MRFLSNKEKKNLKEKLPIGYEVDKKDEIKIQNNLIIKNDNPYLIIMDDNYMPHLKSIPIDKYPRVLVDRGAIPFIAKGADLMRPGIQKIEGEFGEGEVIVIGEEEQLKTIALGITMFDKERLENLDKGKCIKVYHYVGDQFY
jgi:PUA domain protein